MIYLIFKNTETNEEKRSVQVVRNLIIGRSPVADIQLSDDRKISRLHTLVMPRPDGRLDIRDLSSSTGTLVESLGSKKRLLPEPGKKGAEKGRAVLATGEKFFIGDYTVELRYEEILGEPTYHPDYIKAEDEITEVTDLDDEDEI